MQKNNIPSKVKKGVIKLLAIAGDATFCGGLPINTAFTEFGEWAYESWKKRQWNKYLGFFKETEGIKVEQKERILKKFPSEEIDKVENFILYLLDAVDGPEKAKLIGKAYKAWIQNVLDTEELFRICDIINKSYVNDLYHLKNFLGARQEKTIISSNLFSLGLIDVQMTGSSRPGTISTKLLHDTYIISMLGRKVLIIINS